MQDTYYTKISFISNGFNIFGLFLYYMDCMKDLVICNIFGKLVLAESPFFAFKYGFVAFVRSKGSSNFLPNTNFW